MAQRWEAELKLQETRVALRLGLKKIQSHGHMNKFHEKICESHQWNLWRNREKWTTIQVEGKMLQQKFLVDVQLFVLKCLDIRFKTFKDQSLSNLAKLCSGSSTFCKALITDCKAHRHIHKVQRTYWRSVFNRRKRFFRCFQSFFGIYKLYISEKLR